MASSHSIEGDNGRGRPVAFERKRKIGTHKAGPSGNEDAFGHDRAGELNRSRL